MVELALAVAAALLVGGVLGSVLPLLPSGLLSLAGVYAYVFFGSDPLGPLALASLTVVGLVAVVVEQFGGPIAARAGGASTRTVLAAAVAGVALFFVAGPVGILVGMFVVVFLFELADDAEPADAARRAGYTVLGILASSVAQLLLTASILVGFLLAVA